MDRLLQCGCYPSSKRYYVRTTVPVLSPLYIKKNTKPYPSIHPESSHLILATTAKAVAGELALTKVTHISTNLTNDRHIVTLTTKTTVPA